MKPVIEANGTSNKQWLSICTTIIHNSVSSWPARGPFF